MFASLPECSDVPEEIIDQYTQIDNVPAAVTESSRPPHTILKVRIPDEESPNYFQIEEPSVPYVAPAVTYPSVIPTAQIHEIYEELPNCDDVPEEIRGQFKQVESIASAIQHDKRDFHQTQQQEPSFEI